MRRLVLIFATLALLAPAAASAGFSDGGGGDAPAVGKVCESNAPGPPRMHCHWATQTGPGFGDNCESVQCGTNIYCGPALSGVVRAIYDFAPSTYFRCGYHSHYNPNATYDTTRGFVFGCGFTWAACWHWDQV